MYLNIKLIFLGCVIYGLINYQLTEALQCYVCDSCVDGTELKEIQICGELPLESTTQPTTSPATTQSTKPPPVDAQSTSTRVSTTRRKSTRRPTTTTRKSTTKQDSDSEENYSDYEDSDENDRKRRISINNTTIDEENRIHKKKLHAAKEPMNVDSKQFEPVCFMVKFRVNNTQITNLGCTIMVKDNVFLTCQSLNRTDAIMEECQLCGKNGCNKLFLNENNDEYDWEYPWLSGSNKIDLKTVNFLFVVLMMKLIN